MAARSRLTVDTPIGPVKAPVGISQKYRGMTDEELFKDVRHGAFVEPFALAEIQRRGKLLNYYRWLGLI